MCDWSKEGSEEYRYSASLNIVFLVFREWCGDCFKAFFRIIIPDYSNHNVLQDSSIILRHSLADHPLYKLIQRRDHKENYDFRIFSF